MLRSSDAPRSSNLMLVTVAMLSAMFLTAVSSTIVSTAAPSIAASLDGLPLYSWTFSAYLLAMTVTMPLFGKLADLYGRKPIYVASVAMFLAGSLLCGLASSMEQLIAFRFLQGLGAGGIQPVAVTVAGDLFPIQQRARIQGLFSTMWGLASLVGPPLGGFLVEGLGWRWVFWANLPVGLLSAAIMAYALHEQHVPRRRHALDWWGAATLTLGLSALLVALFGLDPTVTIPAPPLPLLAGALALLAVFVWWEARAPEPLLPLSVLRIRVVGVGALLGLSAGVGIAAAASFTTLTMQGVLGTSPMMAGLAMLPMDAVWLIGSFTAGRWLMHAGPRIVVATGFAVVTLSFFAVSRFGPEVPYLVFAAALAPVGFGFGMIVAPLIIAVQNAVGWSQRGVATATNVFFRTLGGAVGMAALGFAFNAQLAALLGGTGADGGQLGVVAQLLDPVQRAALAPATVETLSLALWQSVQGVWLLLGLISLSGLLVVWLLPGGRLEPAPERTPERAPAEAVAEPPLPRARAMEQRG